MSFAPGWVTIEYFSLEHLREQLMILKKAIDSGHGALQLKAEGGSRRGPSSLGSQKTMRARSA
jgi:hypothetical protein